MLYEEPVAQTCFLGLRVSRHGHCHEQSGEPQTYKAGLRYSLATRSRCQRHKRICWQVALAKLIREKTQMLAGMVGFLSVVVWPKRSDAPSK